MSLKVSDATPGDKKELINFDDVKKAAVIIRALNNPLRKRLIDFLLKNETATVTNIVFNLREEQTIISQHLNILRKAKIVTFLKKGKNVYYFLNKPRVAEIQKSLEGLFDEIPIEDLKKIDKP
ncbi:MAG: regulatory protein ArsR [Chitinophagaceae bacterium]|nr:regulatory protein ArsR [Chitinophagaceae bacterium]